MDNLTHSLVGLFLARAGLRKVTPRGTVILVLAANAPDYDIVAWLGGSDFFLRWHRHFTHALIAIPLMAIVTVALVRFIGREQVRWLPAWIVAMVGVLSHVLLDLTNIYGVRLLLPFSGRWFHWDLTPVVDIAVWAVLLLGLAAPALTRLVGSEIGENRKDVGKAGWAVTALLLLFAYDYGRSFAHDKVVAQMEIPRFQGLAARRVGAFPTPNPLKWTGIAELSTSYVTVPVNLVEGFHASDAVTAFKTEQTREVELARASEPFQRFQEFVDYPLWLAEPAPELDGVRVTLMDMRFGSPQAPGFYVMATVDKAGRVKDEVFSMSGRPR